MNDNNTNSKLYEDNIDANESQIVESGDRYFRYNTQSSLRAGHQINSTRGIIMICFYSLIVAVSLCGNCLVCRVAFGKRKMRTTTNMLIASLACSDIIMTALNVPFNVVRLLVLDWPFGGFLCFLVPLISTACVYVSTFTMTVIAVHRWWTVTKRTHPRPFSCCRLAVVVAVIWVLAIALSLPHAVFNEVKRVWLLGRRRYRCRVSHPDIDFLPNIPLFLSVETFITQYLIPIMITCVFYIKIGFVVSKQGQALASVSSDDRRRQLSEAKRRRIIMLALVVCVFATCWLPINVYYLLYDFNVIKHSLNLFIVCHWFAMSSVCYNPFIYCWLNESFRKGGHKCFRLVCKCKTPETLHQNNNNRKNNHIEEQQKDLSCHGLKPIPATGDDNTCTSV